MGLFRQMAVRSHEQVFLDDPFVFLERALDPVYVVAVSIRQRADNPVIALSLRAKEQIRNPGHHFTNAELAHGLVPPTICGPNFPAALTSVATATKKRNKGDYFGTAASKMPPLLAPR